MQNERNEENKTSKNNANYTRHQILCDEIKVWQSITGELRGGKEAFLNERNIAVDVRNTLVEETKTADITGLSSSERWPSSGQDRYWLETVVCLTHPGQTGAVRSEDDLARAAVARN